jgi:hypothetical protein
MLKLDFDGVPQGPAAVQWAADGNLAVMLESR